MVKPALVPEVLDQIETYICDKKSSKKGSRSKEKSYFCDEKFELFFVGTDERVDGRDVRVGVLDDVRVDVHRVITEVNHKTHIKKHLL